MKELKILSFCMAFISLQISQAQNPHNDYLGFGHTTDVTVTTSSGGATAGGNNTIDGFPNGDLGGASRFLNQSTFGGDYETIQAVDDIGFEEWLEEQFNMPITYTTTTMNSIWPTVRNKYIADGESQKAANGPFKQSFRYAWWQNGMTAGDMVRQKVAFALSEIFVVSEMMSALDDGDILCSYYDILLRHSFGNYSDLLLEISLHPAMGVYLSHYTNSRTIEAYNVHPDENYAREIMQLFSIGLHELNIDGSKKLGPDGKEIPTYDNNDIKEFAKIFTGLGAGALANGTTTGLEFYESFYDIDATVPMVFYSDYHEPSEKYLLNGFVVPAGQTGLEDAQQAITHLTNHDNTAPFICKKLIQRLIKANPSPGYIWRVAAKFNNNGEGVRGDLKAVVKAILLDQEARLCGWIKHVQQGMLREPILRQMHLARAFNAQANSGRFWNEGLDFQIKTTQAPLSAPSVFNFFLPDYQPNGPISNAGLVAPAFQIHNSASSISYINEAQKWADGVVMEDVFTTNNNGPTNWDKVRLNFEDEQLLVDNEQWDELIYRLDIILTHQTMGQRTKDIIKLALEQTDSDHLKMAIYLTMISPDYLIFK